MDEDCEPYDNIYHYQRIQRLKKKFSKNLKQNIKEVTNEENFIDKNSNANFWFYNRYK